MKHEQLSEEYLNAFVDNELSASERARLMEQISNDPQLKKQVCELHMLKEMVRSSYHHAYADDLAETTSQRWPYLRHAVAACCLVVVGVMAGWLGHGRYTTDMAFVERVTLNNVVASTEHVVVHLDAASPEVFARALDQTENLLLEASNAGRPLEVHLAANSRGIDLFRASTSPYAGRIHAMQQRYPNLTLIGCGQTLRRLQEQKQDVKLLPNVAVVSSVLDEVVHDLKNGWTYVKV